MVSLIVPYFLTFLGLMTGSAQDFPAFAVFLTFIGVVWTLVRGLAKHSGFKIILLQEAIHAALWLLFNFSPELLGKAIGLVIGLAVAIPLAVVAYVYFIGPLFSGTLGSDSRAAAGAEPAGSGRRGAAAAVHLRRGQQPLDDGLPQRQRRMPLPLRGGQPRSVPAPRQRERKERPDERGAFSLVLMRGA